MRAKDFLFEMGKPNLREFASDQGEDGFSDETLKMLAGEWYNGNEDPSVEKALAAAGWEIGQDEGYDDEPGVFVVRSGDENGNSYMSWPANELRRDLNEDWQSVNKKDKTDGLSPKAVKAYRRENPGSKLQTAVTTKPSKLKAGSKDAKRRKSFCARMSGNKGPMKDEKGRPTPKAKALARWNCEESIEQIEQTLEEAKKKGADGKACWDGYRYNGTSNGKDKCVKVKAKVSEDNIGTTPKRPKRAGSRPDRGHEPQKRYVTDRKTGKQYDPDEEFDKLKNSPEFQDQMKRMATKESRMSAAVKLQRAFEREQAKSAASRKRGEEVMAQAKADVEKKSKEQKVNEGIDMQAATAKAKQLLAQGLSEQQVAEQLVKQGIPLRYAQQAVQAAQINEMSSTLEEMEKELSERGKASRQLCKSSTPDEDLGASQLASCKSQGLRARDGEKSHKLGKTAKSRIKVGGHRIKGHKYGGPLPDWS